MIYKDRNSGFHFDNNIAARSENMDALQKFGFKLSGGAHIARTIMLQDISNLLSTVTVEANTGEYKIAVIENNVLSKKTQSARNEAFSRIRSLYGLSLDIPIFCVYRELLQFESKSLPLLSLLMALARDPILRVSAKVIVDVPLGHELNKEMFKKIIEERYKGEYN